MNIEQVKEFVALEKRKRELDAEVKQIAARLDDLEQALVPQFLNDGINSLRIGGRLVYLVQDIYAGPVDGREQVIAALKASELGQYVSESYSPQSLKAFVREIAEDVRMRCRQESRLFTEDEVRCALPGPLQNALKISFVHSLRTRKD
jgi:hypothetical protein